jgi:hypothetical protein
MSDRPAPSKALAPIVKSVDGRIIEDPNVGPDVNADAPIIVSPSFSVAVSNDVQPENA